MADPVIGALSVILGGDASALDKMLKGAQNSVSSFAKNVTAIATGMGLEKAIEGALSSLVGAIKQGLADADALAKMAQQTGIGVEQLSKLKYAGDQSGVSLDELGKSLQSLSAAMASAASGAITPGTKALDAMGISVKNTDGTMKSSAQVLDEIADKYATYRDGANKAKLSQDLFGAGGEALIPMLNKGSAGLAEMGDEAQKLGLVLDAKTQFAVLSLNDNLKKMDAIKQGLVATITARLLPAFEQISAVMLEAKQNTSLMNAVSEGLTTALTKTVSIALQGILVFSRLAAELNALKKWGDAPMFSEESSAAWAAYLAEGEKTKQMFADLDKQMAKIAQDGTAAWDVQIFDVKFMQSEVAKLGETWLKTKDAPTEAADATTNALQIFIDRTAKSTAAVRAEADTVGMASDVLAAHKVQLEATAIATAKIITITDAYRLAIDAAAKAAAAAAQALAGAKLTQDVLAPWEQRNKLLEQYNTLLQAGAISSATFSAASLKLQFPNFVAASNAALDFGASLDKLATDSLNNVASSLAAVITGAKSAAQAFKDFALQVITQLIEMIIKAVIFKAIMAALGFSDGGAVSMSPGDAATNGHGLYDAGGYTGPGNRLEPAGVVHKGEDVFSQADVARWGGIANVEKLRLNGPMSLPSFSGGGAVVASIASAPSMLYPGAQAPAAPAATPVTLNWRGGITDRSALADLIADLNGMFKNGYRLKLAGA